MESELPLQEGLSEVHADTGRLCSPKARGDAGGHVKLAVLTNILAPYRIPLFEALQRRVEEVSVLLMAQQEENRQWTVGEVPFRTEVLPGFHFQPKGRDVSLHVNYGVMAALKRFNPDVVVSGGYAAANIQAMLYCRVFRTAFVSWGELTSKDGKGASGVRRILRRWVTSGSAGAIASSSEAGDAFVHHGMDRERVLLALLPVNVMDWRERTDQFRESLESLQLHERFGSPLLLSIGQIIPRKGYRELFDMYAQVLQRRPDVSLVIAGDGPDRAKLEEEAQIRGWDRVHFLGFVPASELHKYFAIADVFVFHTLYDPFGAVISEAMASMVPVVSSIHANSTGDLIDDGVTGYRIDPREARTSAETILTLLNLSEERRQALVTAASERIAKWDVEPVADAVVSFLSRLSRESELQV
ncbi:MAG: glycosyltransferase family 4 protein [Nitrospira sp.]|nr:MAG: glycosyltransferase family 4 protein [Nitrospira sp.]